MAAESPELKIKGLEVQMSDMKTAVSDLKEFTSQGFKDVQTKLDSLSKGFVPRDEFNSYKAQQTARTLYTVVVTAVLTLLLGYVATQFFASLKTPNPSATTNSTTTTTNSSTPAGSTPSASANSSATSTPANPKATDSQSSGGGITVPLPALKTP